MTAGPGPAKEALANLEKAIGGRQTLIDALILAPLDQRQQAFLRLLADPLRIHDNLATICADAGILPGQVIELFRNASAARAFAIGMTNLHAKLPGVIEDVTTKAQDYTQMCPDCRGEGNIDEKKCDKCKGHGTLLRTSDIDRQKLVFEAAGMLKKGGINVNVQQNNQTVVPSNFFSKVVKSTDAAAYDIEGEVVDAEG